MPACVPYFLCAFFLASSSPSHPYTDPTAPMKVNGRHVGIGGNAYTNVGPAYTVTRYDGGVEYPVYILKISDPAHR